MTTNVINLTNLIQSAEAANVDLKKINEAIQNGQSFEDVLKGIVEELKAKTSSEASTSSDKKVGNSKYSQDKSLEGKNVQDKTNISEDIAQSKVNKTSSNSDNVPSKLNIDTEKLKESLEPLESATQKIEQNSQSNKPNENSEKISTNQLNQTNQPKQVVISDDRVKNLDNSVIEESVEQTEKQKISSDIDDIKKDTAKNTVKNVDPNIKKSQDSNTIRDDQNIQHKLNGLNENDKSNRLPNLSLEQMKEPLSRKLPITDTNTGTNAKKVIDQSTISNSTADTKQSINTVKSTEVVETVKTESKGIEKVYANNLTQQEKITNTTLLTDALKVLVENTRNVETQHLNANNDNNVSINQTNQQKQTLVNAKNAVTTIDSNTDLGKNVVQSKTEKVSNNQSIIENNSNITTKTLTSPTVTLTFNATSAVTTENSNGANSKAKKNEVAVTVQPIDSEMSKNDGVIKQVKHTDNQSANAQSTKGVTGTTVAVNESTIAKAVQVNVDTKSVLVGNVDNKNVKGNSSRDINQTLDLLTNFSKFTNESQVILLIPVLLSKVQDPNNVISNANGFSNSKESSEKPLVNVVSNIATVTSNPILKVETKINDSTQKILEAISNARNITQDIDKNSDNVVPSTTTQSVYLQQVLVRNAKADVKEGTAASAIANGNEDNKRTLNSNALIMSELVKNVKIPKIEDGSFSNEPNQIFDRVVDSRTRQSNYDDQKYIDFYKNLRNNTDDVSKNKLEIKSIQIEYTERKEHSNSGNSKETLEGKPNVSNKFAERLAELSYKANGERPEVDSTISMGQSASSDRASDLDLAERLQNSRNLEEIYEKIKQFATSYRLEEKVQMKLFPEELGNLDVELKKEGKQIQILFLAENEKAKDTIEKNSYILRERLASLDFEVRTFEVKVREEERYYDQKQGQEEGKNQNSQNGRNSRNGRSYQEAEENNKNNNRKWVIKDDDEREFGV